MSIKAENYDSADGQTRSVWRVDTNDTSSIWVGYTRFCPYCLYGQCHSTDLHHAEINRAESRRVGK